MGLTLRKTPRWRARTMVAGAVVAVIMTTVAAAQGVGA